MYLTKKKLGQEGPRPSLGCVLSHIHVDLHLTLYKIMAKYVAKFVQIDFSIFCFLLQVKDGLAVNTFSLFMAEKFYFYYFKQIHNFCYNS